MALTMRAGGRSVAGKETGGRTPPLFSTSEAELELGCCDFLFCCFTKELAYSKTVDLSSLSWLFSNGISRSEKVDFNLTELRNL